MPVAASELHFKLMRYTDPPSSLQEYANLPRLTGRSVVEFQVEQKDGSLAFVDPVKGGLTSTGIVQVRC